MPWKPHPVSQLERDNGQLRTTICCLRRELENKTGAVGRLEVLLHDRLNRIDELNAQVDRLRQQNRQLDAEADRLAEMVRFS